VSDIHDIDSPIFWELVAKYGPKLVTESPWSPEVLETPWPSTFDGALDYVTRLVGSQYDTQYLPVLALDQYAQQVDLDDPTVTEVIQGVLVDD